MDLIPLNSGSKYKFMGNKISEEASLVDLTENGFIFSYGKEKLAFSDFSGKCRKHQVVDNKFYYQELKIPDNVIEIFGDTIKNFKYQDYVNHQEFSQVLHL